LVKREFTDIELQAQILYSLYVHAKWSEIYTSYDSFKRRLSNVVNNNGKNTDKQVKSLVKQRLVFFRKNGNTIALNPYAKLTIKEIIRKNLDINV
jgi:uncharacterized protein YdcH (DUF465 family)